MIFTFYYKKTYYTMNLQLLFNDSYRFIDIFFNVMYHLIGENYVEIEICN